LKQTCLAILCLLSTAAFSQVVIGDGDINAGETFTMTSDNEYILDGFVFVEDGATLIIQAGTVVRGMATPTTGDNASALIISRGGRIEAEGTAANPIVMTSETDDLEDPFDLTPSNRGLWGGLILLGYGEVNGGEDAIEGIPTGEARALFGGNDNTDSSGILRYVSVRHSGAALAPGDEINGVTMGGVGSGTIIEYVEVYANDDDGFEWFGGAVSTKYLTASFCADDPFDWDAGWRGKNQFWFSVQGADFAGRMGEHDGVTEAGATFTKSDVYNATYIGPGTNVIPEGDGSEAIIFRDNGGGGYWSSIITEYNGTNAGAGITVEDEGGVADSRERMAMGDLTIANNIWWQFGDGNDIAAIAPQDFVQTHLLENCNKITDPALGGVSRVQDGGLDPRPAADGPAGAGAPAPHDPWYENTGYYGAFDPNAPLWINGWTALAQEGHLGENLIVINDGAINAGESVTLTADNEYLLDGFVFVEDGATLTIEAGTVIRGKAVPSTDDNASALIISRGAKIIADGTAEHPIIMTSETDDLSDPNDITWAQNGLWGGLIVLGYGEVNGGEDAIEGIPTGETRALFGGDNNADNSGIIRYVSVRHSGAALAPGDEINGVTFGGVGSGTIVEYVEVFANEDDGFEWFGGAVNTRYLVAGFNADDAFDWDSGWRGKNQFWFAIQDTAFAGRIGEHDGITEAGATFSKPYVYNATYIGPGTSVIPEGDGSEAIIFRDNTGGIYQSSIITEYNGTNGGAGITVEDEGGNDSRERLEEGNLVVGNNLWWQFGNGNDIAAIAPQDFVQEHLIANKNQIVDPQLRGISRINDGGLDPRPSAAGPAAHGAPAPSDPFFQHTSFYGAFDPDSPSWIDGWTALSHEGHLGDMGSKRAINHVTRTDQDFATTFFMVNNAGSDQTVTLHAYAADGSALGSRDYTVAAGGTASTLSTDAFPGMEVSHVSIYGSDYVRVSAGYKVTTTTGATAHVNETTQTSTSFAILPGEGDVVFDGMALVNYGNADATVNVTYYDAAGNQTGAESAATVAPKAKMLVAFAAPAGTSLIQVDSSRQAGVVFLRGTNAGTTPAILYEVAPIAGN